MKAARIELVVVADDGDEYSMRHSLNPRFFDMDVVKRNDARNSALTSDEEAELKKWLLGNTITGLATWAMRALALVLREMALSEIKRKSVKK